MAVAHGATPEQLRCLAKGEHGFSVVRVIGGTGLCCFTQLFRFTSIDGAFSVLKVAG